MRTVSYKTGTAPASLVVIQGMGRALNPTKRSGKPQESNLSARGYDNVRAKHRSHFELTGEVSKSGLAWAKSVGGGFVNNFRTEAFDTPVRVWAKNSGWLTVAGGKDGLTVTFAPDAVVKYAEVLDEETGEVEVIMGITLFDYMTNYC